MLKFIFGQSLPIFSGSVISEMNQGVNHADDYQFIVEVQDILDAVKRELGEQQDQDSWIKSRTITSVLGNLQLYDKERRTHTTTGNHKGRAAIKVSLQDVKDRKQRARLSDNGNSGEDGEVSEASEAKKGCRE